MTNQNFKTMLSGVFSKAENLALFAGSGVGVRAGLPDWLAYLYHLSEILRKYDEQAADFMCAQIEKDRYLYAGQIYKESMDIPVAEKYTGMASPFVNPPHPEKLNALASLPFSIAVTTNYDRSLHKAFAHITNQDILNVELGDSFMKESIWYDGFYIARIHGRAEVPNSIVLDSNDYQRTKEDPNYEDFVVSVLTKYKCIFIGYSFNDPAINRIFGVIEERLSPSFPQTHIALIPENSDPVLIDRLAKWNIATWVYDQQNKHEELWETIAEISRSFSSKQKVEKPKTEFPLEGIKRYLAASYAQVKLANKITPLRDLVVDGIILNSLSIEKSIEIDDLSGQVAAVVKIAKVESKKIVDFRLKDLAGRGLVHITDDEVKLAKERDNPLNKDLDFLTRGVSNRLIVRSAIINPSQTHLITAKNCIENIIVARSWDLGISYVGETILERPDLFETIANSINKINPKLTDRDQEALTYSIYDLFQFPNKQESGLLANLGRIGFALQLVLNNPTSSITHKSLLPEKIYLDANFLLRAMVDGHPQYPVYVDALRTLVNANTASGGATAVLTAKNFLEEVLAHRSNAIREVEQLGLETASALKSYIGIFNSESINVFIAGYSGWNDRTTTKMITFHEFLNHAAPYKTVPELQKFLAHRGIQTVNPYVHPDEMGNYMKILNELNSAYENKTRSGRVKEPVLIENEARQIFLLLKDYSSNIKSIFVTGDVRLRTISIGEILGKAGLVMLSNRGFIQLVDMLIGIKSEPEAITRLLWGSPINDQRSAILIHFTNMALREYDTALAKSIPEVLETFVPKILGEAVNQRIDLVSPETISEKSRTAKFFDRFEDEFYEIMAEKMREQNEKGHD